MANSPILLKSLDFQNFKDELKSYVRSKTPFTDVDFDGSNANYLLDIFAYVTNYLGYLSHAAYSETFVDSAILRSDLLSRARDLNYFPNKYTSASAYVELKIEDPYLIQTEFPTFNPLVDTVVLPAYSVFNSSDSFQFLTVQDHTFSSANNFTISINIHEGIWVADEVLAISDGSENQKYEISIKDLTDDFVLKVSGVEWTNQNDITLWSDDTKYYQYYENYRENFVVEFGNGSTGMIPLDDAEITISYLRSNGKNGNNKTGFSLLSSSYINGDVSKEIDNTTFILTELSRSVGGKNKETTEELRKNAPKFYASQNKAITKYDYDIILRKHSYVEYLNVYGGDELNPPLYGFIVATIKPPGADQLTTEQKEELKAYLESYHVQGIRFEIKDPVYLYFKFQVHNNYDLKRYSSTNVISASKTALYNFFEDLKENGSDFYYSKIFKELDDVDGVISTRVSFDTYVMIEENVDQTYFFDFGQKIRSGSIDLTFDTVKGWYDLNGKIYDRESDLEIGIIDYDKGILTISDYDKVVSGDQHKMFVEFDVEDISLYQNMLFVYDDISTTFTSSGVRN